jgi:hypothetical protein
LRLLQTQKAPAEESYVDKQVLSLRLNIGRDDKKNAENEKPPCDTQAPGKPTEGYGHGESEGNIDKHSKGDERAREARDSEKAQGAIGKNNVCAQLQPILVGVG